MVRVDGRPVVIDWGHCRRPTGMEPWLPIDRWIGLATQRTSLGGLRERHTELAAADAWLAGAGAVVGRMAPRLVALRHFSCDVLNDARYAGVTRAADAEV